MRYALAFLAFTALSACGFQPVYSPATQNLSGSSINIPEIQGRSGHSLRKALIAELAPGLPGVEDATLTVTLRDNLQRLAIRPDEAAARTDVVATGRYILDTGDAAISGEVRSETSFNVPGGAFADIASQTDATERAVIQLARLIAEDLKLKLLEEQ
ncbi:MAG: hypothetical protein AAFS13_02355 [Pseudomonadota bacterium]